MTLLGSIVFFALGYYAGGFNKTTRKDMAYTLSLGFITGYRQGFFESENKMVNKLGSYSDKVHHLLADEITSQIKKEENNDVN